jgi:hypothetical protein
MGLFGKGKKIFDSTATVHYTDTYTIGGKTIRCGHCGHEKFDIASALLNTPGMTFFGLDWANRCATLLCCRGCGRIEWFLKEPSEIR